MRREAQRCLANALYLKPDTRKIFVEVGGLKQFVTAFQTCSNNRNGDDDFLLGRIGFLLTAQKGDIVEKLVNDDHILGEITKVRPSIFASLT